MEDGKNLHDGMPPIVSADIKPRVTLQPFRTFLEVEQPAGEYIFRVQPGNSCALFEADGGLWRLKAMDLVKGWLKNNLAASTNPVVSNLQVIA